MCAIRVAPVEPFSTQWHTVCVGRSIMSSTAFQAARPPRSPKRLLVAGRIAEVLDYFFGLVFALLLARLVLEVLEARRGIGVFETIRSVTDLLYAPFKIVVGARFSDEGPVMWPLVISTMGYSLLFATVRWSLRLVS